MYYDHLRCRACGFGQPVQAEGIKILPSSDRLQPVFDLGLQPLANDFRKDTEEKSGFAPLKVMLCPQCGLAQLSVIVPPEVLYKHYSYVTSTSQTMKRHFEHLVDVLPLESHAWTALEIGSNDGLFLDFLAHKGMKVMGVDPAENLCRKAHDRGLTVFCEFFGERCAIRIRNGDWPNGLKFDLIIARHVFCHCPDWRDFIKGLEILCGKETLICIEVPYVLDLLEKGEFDTIYHEHLSYFSVKAMSYLLKDTTLRLAKIVRMDIHGGALLVMLRHVDSDCPPHKSVTDAIITEQDEDRLWREFSVKSHAKIGALHAFVDNAVANGKTVCGFGASAKSTVWVNAAEFSRKQIAFITDNTPEKLYRQSPGTDIPIVDEGALLREQPDFAILFAWNYLNEVIQKNAAYVAKGGAFVVPHPEIKVIR